MFRFENPEYLWLLWLIVVLAIVRYYGLWRRQKDLKRIGDKSLVSALMPDASAMRRRVKFWLLMGAVAILVVAIARPQMGSKISNEKRDGIETIICLDISNSMLAKDVAPSRLDKSKMLVENLVDNCSNDKVGLVVFAGDAFVQLPITSDYVSAKMFLQGTGPQLISTQGTDVARALSVASSSFTQQQGIGRAIILITDGEDNEGGALEAAKAAHKKGINVFILGIGSTKGAPIPTGGGDYIRDNAGNIVMSALNENLCRDIARAGNGTYIHVDNTNDAQEKLNEELSRLQKGETESVVYSEYAEQFQSFCILLLVLLILEACIMDKKNPLLKNIRLFKNR